jgi:hypothetical protein
MVDGWDSGRRQRDAQLPTRPVVGAQEHIIDQAEGHRGFAGSMLLELLLQAVSVVEHVRQALRTRGGDEGGPSLPGQVNRPHEGISSHLVDAPSSLGYGNRCEAATTIRQGLAWDARNAALVEPVGVIRGRLALVVKVGLRFGLRREGITVGIAGCGRWCRTRIWLSSAVPSCWPVNSESVCFRPSRSISVALRLLVQGIRIYDGARILF